MLTRGTKSEISYSKLWLQKMKLMQDEELSFTSFCFVNIFPNTNFWFVSLICILIVLHISMLQ